MSEFFKAFIQVFVGTTKTTLMQVGGRVVRWPWVIFQCRGILQFWMIEGQGPTALAVGAGGYCLDIFTLIYPLSSVSLSLGDGPI